MLHYILTSMLNLVWRSTDRICLHGAYMSFKNKKPSR